MNATLLAKLFGTDGRWSDACTVILDADANIQPTANDSIVQGGVKSFAPRLISGRIPADSVRFLPEHAALLLVQNVVIRQPTGDDTVKKTLLIVDASHVAAIEFAELAALSRLGITAPEVRIRPSLAASRRRRRSCEGLRLAAKLCWFPSRKNHLSPRR